MGSVGTLTGATPRRRAVKLGLDHAPGADPFITTIKDFSGLAVYFLLATALLGIGG